MCCNRASLVGLVPRDHDSTLVRHWGTYNSSSICLILLTVIHTSIYKVETTVLSSWYHDVIVRSWYENALFPWVFMSVRYWVYHDLTDLDNCIAASTVISSTTSSRSLVKVSNFLTSHVNFIIQQWSNACITLSCSTVAPVHLSYGRQTMELNKISFFWNKFSSDIYNCCHCFCLLSGFNNLLGGSL